MILMTLLSGCAGVIFDPRACPREQEYTKQQQEQAARELPKAGPMVQRFIVDYGKLRDKARACRGAGR